MAAEIRRYDDIMQQATANMIARTDKITDYNPGSIAHTFCDTISRIAERIYVAIRQGYNENLGLIPYFFFGLQRKQGAFANGTVIFKRENPLPTRTTIPVNTKISGAGRIYLTTETGFIEPGAILSNEVKVLAAERGKNQNVAALTIDTIETIVSSDIVEVTNPHPITGGLDTESDAEFEERFKIHVNGLSGTNDYAIIGAARNVDGVRSVSAKNHKPPLRNIYNMSIYVDDGSGSATPETIEAVKLAITGDGTALHQGHLAPGVEVRVLPPQTVPVNFSVIVDVYRADLTEAEAEIQRIIAEYVNSLTIGKPVIKSQILARITKLAYVRDVKIIAPTENIEIGPDQIARFNSAEIELRETANG
jgi:uncharacterized phage protein gp47/JayE